MISMGSTDLGQAVAGLPGMTFLGDDSGQACNQGGKVNYYKDKCYMQTPNLDNKYFGSFYLPEWNISM